VLEPLHIPLRLSFPKGRTLQKNSPHQITVVKNRGMLISPISSDAFEFVRRVMSACSIDPQSTDRV